MIKKRKVSESNGNGKSDKKPDRSDELPPKQVKIEQTSGTSSEENNSVGAFKCIGILPGICGMYAESSDSEKSTDTDDDYDYSKFDWVGRSKGSQSGGCGQ